MRCPASIPATAGTMARLFRPAGMAQAQSAPGVITNRTDGLNFSAWVFVTLREGDRGAVGAFEEALARVPQVVQAQRLFGEPDHLMRAVERDLPAFQRLYDEHLAALPGVQRLTSTLVMKDLINDRPLPL